MTNNENSFEETYDEAAYQLFAEPLEYKMPRFSLPQESFPLIDGEEVIMF